MPPSDRDQALRAIIANADLLDVVTRDQRGRLSVRWLLVRAPAWLLDLLARYEAGLEDLEDGHDGEATDLAAGNDVDQEDAWRRSSLVASEHDDGDVEPDDAATLVWAPDWQPERFLASEAGD